MDAGHRRRGIGMRLMRAALEHVERVGVAIERARVLDRSFLRHTAGCCRELRKEVAGVRGGAAWKRGILPGAADRDR